MASPSQPELSQLARTRAWIWKHLGLKTRVFKSVALATLIGSGAGVFHEMREPCLDEKVAAGAPSMTQRGLMRLQFAGDVATAS